MGGRPHYGAKAAHARKRPEQNDTDVVIVGGGIAGISAAYELAQKGAHVILLEAGRIGQGSSEFRSGTNGPAFSKMLCPSTVDSDIDTLRGDKGLDNDAIRGYLGMARLGNEIIVGRAQGFNPALVRKYGTIVAGHGVQRQWIEEEKGRYHWLGFGKNFGKEVSRKELSDMFGFRETAFDGGRHLPSDGIVDQNAYLRALAREAVNTGRVQILEGTKVTGIEEYGSQVYINSNNRPDIRAGKVLLATNGFYPDKRLEGLVQPMWTSIVCFDDADKPDTPNFWQFAEVYNYLKRTNGVLMFGGEDRVAKPGEFARYDPRNVPNRHGSAYPDDRLVAAAQRLMPRFAGKEPLERHSGVFSATPDELPIVGRFGKNDRVYFLVGDNGIGHTMLTAGASLLPVIMDYATPTAEQQRYIQLVSPQRETLKR